MVFWIAGYSNITRFWTSGYRVFIRNLVSILLLIIFGVFLWVRTHHEVSNMLFEADVRKILQGYLKEYPGSYLNEVRFDETDAKTLISAVVRSPSSFTAQDVAAMERRLPSAPNGSGIELRVRRVAVQVMTDKGPLFETE